MKSQTIGTSLVTLAALFSIRNHLVSAKGSDSTVIHVIKLALFIDSTLEEHLKHKFNYTQQQTLYIDQLLSAYVQQVDAIFSKLETEPPIRLQLVKIYLQSELSNNGNNSIYDSNNSSLMADIDQLLDSFCYLQSETRLAATSNQWDLSILLTALDLYSGEESKLYSMETSRATLGVSIPSGIHWPQEFGCLIVEFGANHPRGKFLNHKTNTYSLTTGFGSAWVAAHEIGHSLGIHHDGPPFNKDCSPNRWIMSANSSPIESISTNWSVCSTDSIRQMNLKHLQKQAQQFDNFNSTLSQLPGQLFDANFQCKLFDERLLASNSNDDSICSKTLRCQEISHDFEHQISIGPALEGTVCRHDGSICVRNKCKKTSDYMES